jgi:hypothetical protein
MIRLIRVLFLFVRILLSRVGGGTGPMKPSNLPEYALQRFFACVFDRNFGDGANLSKEKTLER